MSEVMWVWDYELKTLGSWPSTGYNGHNTPVEVVTQMDVKVLRDERDRLRANLINCSERLAAYYGDNYPAVVDARAALTPGGQRLTPNDIPMGHSISQRMAIANASFASRREPPRCNEGGSEHGGG